WVAGCTEKMLYRIEDSSGKVLAKIPLGLADYGGEMSISTGADIAAADGKVWVSSTNTEKPVQIIDEITGNIEVAYIQTNKNIDKKPFKVDGGIRLTGKYVWTTGYHSKTIWLLKR
ncbi:MAG: hypothetical protein Q8R50_13195, partial [Sediminibacterium sp.]|nr:hypothetical protein [Sediminibacterium sp.]